MECFAFVPSCVCASKKPGCVDAVSHLSHCVDSRESWISPIFVFVCLFWGELAQLKLMKSHGNASARALYEKAVPPYYYRPQQDDCA